MKAEWFSVCLGWLVAEGGGVSPGLYLLQFIRCKYIRHYLLDFMNFAPRVFPMLKTHQICSNMKKKRVPTKFVNSSNCFKKVLKTTLLFLKWLRITLSENEIFEATLWTKTDHIGFFEA